MYMMTSSHFSLSQCYWELTERFVQPNSTISRYVTSQVTDYSSTHLTKDPQKYSCHKAWLKHSSWLSIGCRVIVRVQIKTTPYLSSPSNTGRVSGKLYATTRSWYTIP